MAGWCCGRGSRGFVRGNVGSWLGGMLGVGELGDGMEGGGEGGGGEEGEA